MNPGAAEACNGADDDCDDAVDEGLDVTWYADGDGDGFGLDNDCDDTTPIEEQGAGWEHAAGREDLAATLSAGTSDTPVALELADGTLHVCDGTWYVNLAASGATRIVGHGSAAAPVLDGAGLGSVVAVTGDGADVSVEGLTLRNGAGTTNGETTAGGDLYCKCSGGSSVTVIVSDLEYGTAWYGGAI